MNTKVTPRFLEYVRQWQEVHRYILIRHCRQAHQDYEREEDEGFAVNPSGSSVQNNIIISKQNKVGEIAKTVKKYSVVENNQTFTLNGAKSSFEDYENGDYRIKEDSKISKECSDFKEIPFNEIGRK